MKKLKVNYMAFFLTNLFIMLFSVVFLLITIFDFEPSDELIYEILWYSILGACFLLPIVLFFLDYQIAELTEKSIAIKSLFGLIKSIEWKDIYDIRIETLISGTAGVMTFTKEWIVIYTDANQFDLYFKPNRRKKKGPWYIAATKQNIKIVNEYMIKYLPTVLPIEP